jgi:integrase
MASISVDLHRGSYIDPRAGGLHFDELAERWLASRTADASTVRQAELQIRRHMNPTWGSRSIISIRPSEVQAWISGLQTNLAAKYIRLIFQNFRAVLSSAVEDGLLAKNPAVSRSVNLPAISQQRIEVWTMEQMRSVVAHHPASFRAVPLLGAMCGLRQGETFGLRIQDIDFENQEINVRQQIKLIDTKPTPALPKMRKTRVVPMPDELVRALRTHLDASEVLPGEQTLSPGEGGLLFSFRERKPLNKNYYNPTIWKPAITAAGLPLIRSNGSHALRHFCASRWLDYGVSIRAVSEYLGHADPGFTLRVYTHMMPKSDEKAREAFQSLIDRNQSTSF